MSYINYCTIPNLNVDANKFIKHERAFVDLLYEMITVMLPRELSCGVYWNTVELPHTLLLNTLYTPLMCKYIESELATELAQKLSDTQYIDHILILIKIYCNRIFQVRCSMYC